MTKFDRVKFLKSLNTLPFPVAHTVFLEEQTAPYLIYTCEDYTLTAANSETIMEQTEIVLELYTAPGQTDSAEDILETFLHDFTTYEKARSYIAEEKLYVTYYTFDL